jgi:glycosyltransferase involved in cell wall biosynthesis
MNMRVCVVGNYGDGTHRVTDGQGIKTVELYEALREHYGDKKVCKLNLYSKNKLILGIKLVICMLRCSHLIVLVSKNGRITIVPLMVSLNKLFHRKIFHSLIGSTTHQTMEERPELVNVYNSLAGNWSETSTEMELLEKAGLKNVCVVKNFKSLTIVPDTELHDYNDPVFRFCTFSRVEELKGIPNIVRAIKRVNSEYGKTIACLDIYGKVQDTYESGFDELKKEFDESICYNGVVDFDKSVETLKPYFMLVFPTLYYTEGIPGTLIDSMAAGVPILSAEWESCFDIMKPEVGITYKFGNDDDLVDKLKFTIENANAINAMKIACLKEAKKYLREEAIKEVCQKLEG